MAPIFVLFHMLRINRAVGNFTQIVTDDVHKLGCGATLWDSKRSDGKLYTHTYLVCDYSRANFVGSPVYAMGASASACTTGKNNDYPALCSVDEYENN